LSNFPDLSGKTILQIIPALDAGGAERAVIDMAEAIVKAGGKALVASEGGRLAPALREAGGELIEMDMASKNPVKMFQNAKALEKLITAHTVSLVHARSRAPAWSALRATQATQTPFVTTYHGAYSGKLWPKVFYNSVMARGDLIIANSGWTGAHVRDTHSVDNDRRPAHMCAIRTAWIMTALSSSRAGSILTSLTLKKSALKGFLPSAKPGASDRKTSVLSCCFQRG